MIRDPRERYRESMGRSTYRKWKVGLETANWLHSARLAERNQRQYPASYKIVRYETLVSDPEGTIRDACSFLQEQYAPAMTLQAPRTDDGPGDKAGTGGEQIQGTHSRDISEREIGCIQMYARRYMLANAYPLKPVLLSTKDRLLFYAVDWPANLASMGAGHLYHSWKE